MHHLKAALQEAANKFMEKKNRSLFSSSLRRPFNLRPVAVLLILVGCLGASAKNNPPFYTPGQLWPDRRGVHINAHGGGILLHKGTYYWYGEHKTEGSGGNVANVGFHCYSSRDLYEWKDEGIVLKVMPADSESELRQGCIMERPKVIYNARSGKYVMWFHHEPRGQGYGGARSGIAVADSPTGPFTFLKSIRANAGKWPMNYPDELKKAPLRTDGISFSGGSSPAHPDSLNIVKRDLEQGQMARDMTLFVDDDGKAYHIYASEENSTLHIAQLTDDYLGHTGRYARFFAGRFMEAPAMFKKDGMYYLILSGCTGWAPNAGRAAVAPSIWGPWTELENPFRGADAQVSFHSQGTFVIPAPGQKDHFIYMGDRWKPEDAIDGRYVWLPIRFEGPQPVIEWKDSWRYSQTELFCTDDGTRMTRAVPVWASGREKEMNLTLGFRGAFLCGGGGEGVRLKIAASTLYRAYVNGRFVASGPARAAHGYFRVDTLRVDRKWLHEGENTVAIEVAGYNVNTYYTLDQPSFLLAEVEVDGRAVLATGRKGSNNEFEVFRLRERQQKVERYSFQRPFTEYYRMSEGYDRWRTSMTHPVEKLKVAAYPLPRLLPRNVRMPGFELAEPVALYAKGRFERIKPETYYKDRSLTIISPTLKGYSEAELEVPPQSQAIQEVVTSEREIINKPPISAGAVALREGEFYIYDFGRDYSGFIGARLTCGSRTKICFHFDELLTDGDVLPMQRQPDINNQVVYELEPGSYDLESFETYTFRYLKALLWEGDCRIENVYVREFAYPAHPKATFHSSHAKLNRIYDAARQTSRQNALDVFMDCPSRERAGWLCDSYYAAIMEKELTGRADVAHNFYENYALPDSFRYLPEGMIPMCYPADHNDRIFIPNWSLWFILQVEDYALRGGDPRLVAQLKTRIEKLLGYFARFENEDGLLEKLERWIFLEWSKANEFVRDVNYPTNMLYAAALSSAARLYGNERWEQKAQDIRQTIVRQSFDGEFFVDNALRNQDGVLETTANTTEVCQYYAFYFGLATPDSHPELWRKLITHFGPNRNDAVVYPTVFRANAFMGNYMRMDILSRFGRQGQLILEIQDYFYAMADQTGTLWEHTSHHASCNHGFASYIGHVLYRDVLGITHIDYRAKAVTIRFADLVMDHCSGSIPIGNDCVALKWKRDGNRIHYSLHVPEGYSVILQNDTPAILEHDESISGVPSTLIFLTKQTYLFL